MDRDKFGDYVSAHGHGFPTAEGYELGKRLLDNGDDYATAAFEVVFRGLTKEEDDSAVL